MANGTGRLEIAAAVVVIVAVLAITLGREAGDRPPAAADLTTEVATTASPSPTRTTPPAELLASPGTPKAAQLDEYAAAIDAICRQATDELSRWEHEHANLRGTSVFHFQTLDDAEAWSAEAIQLGDGALGALWSMPSPGSVATPMVGDVMPALEASLEPLRDVGAAARSGDFDAVEALMRARIEGTKAKDAIVRNVPWPALAEALEGCPIRLGV